MAPARPPGVAPVESLSRKDSVVAAIRRAVVAGTLRPGDRLTEVSLASTLGVSRHTLREAINLLVLDGTLSQEPYKGLYVTKLVSQDTRDLARTRYALDMLAATSILEDPTGRRRRSLQQGWETFERLVFHPDPLVCHEAHIALHRQIWVASENSVLLRMWPVVQAQLTVALAQDQSLHPDPQREHDLHLRLVTAILGGDMAEIEAELVGHTIDSAEAIARTWSE